MVEEGSSGAKPAGSAPEPPPDGHAAGPRGRGFIAAAVIAALIVAIGASWWHKQEKRRTSAHQGEEATTDVYLAALQAPEGATPCDSSYNALSAMQRVIEEKHLPPMFRQFPPREAFLSMCHALPPDVQPCLVPRYRDGHQDDCEQAEERARSTDAAMTLANWIGIDERAAPPDASAR